LLVIFYLVKFGTDICVWIKFDSNICSMLDLTVIHVYSGLHLIIKFVFCLII